MNTYLYRIQPARSDMLKTGATAEEDLIIAEHFDYLNDLKEKGVVWMAGRTLTEDPDTFGIVIFYAADDPDAVIIMQNDPAVKNQVMKAKLFPFRIAISQMD